MSKFLLLHDNDNEGKLAVVRADIITSVVETENYDYERGSVIYTQCNEGESIVLEAKESVKEIYEMLNK